MPGHPSSAASPAHAGQTSSPRLNHAQREAVTYCNGACLVLAGAGAGKTSVITEKVGYLISHAGLPAEQILAVTFTNKAASEMQTRVAARLGTACACQVAICTFHAWGRRFLREEHQAAGLRENFAIFDEYDQLKALAEVMRGKFRGTFKEGSRAELRKYLAGISLAKARLAEADPQARELGERLFAEYQAYLRACNAVDFDDLIYIPTLLLSHNSGLSRRWAQRYRYILVDEYQDTNRAQYALLRILVKEAQGFTVVGDDDQAIYAWRGADAGNLASLQKDFANLMVIKLEQNYRSASNILKCANQLIAHNQHLYAKHLTSEIAPGEKIQIVACTDDDNEARFIAASIYDRRRRLGCTWQSCAVLFRSNMQAQALERVFSERQIPHVVIGTDSFFDRAEIRDLLAYCRLLANYDDEISLLRIINVPRRGIGPETLERLAHFARANALSTFRAACHAQFIASLSGGPQRAILNFTALIERLQQSIVFAPDGKSRAVAAIPAQIGYEEYLRQSRLDEQAVAVRLKNVATLLRWIGDLIDGRRSGEPMTFREAVRTIALRDSTTRDSERQPADAVQLMTLHSAKGLEFPHVYLAGCEDSTLPHKNALELPHGEAEERRLAYVGITRAQQSLTLSYRTCRQVANRTWAMSGAQQVTDANLRPSRFLRELPPEEVVWTDSRQASGGTPQANRQALLDSCAQLLKQVGAAGLARQR